MRKGLSLFLVALSGLQVVVAQLDKTIKNPAYQSAKLQIDQAQSDSAKLRAYLNWIEDNKETDAKVLLQLSEEAFEISKKLQMFISESFLAMGYANLINKNYSRAVLYYQAARDYVIATSDIKFRPKVFLEMGKYYEWRDRYDSAFYFYEASFKHANDSKNTNAIILAYLSIGKMYEIQRLQSGAISQYKKALQLSQSEKNIQLEAQIYSKIGDAFSEINKYDSAQNYHNKALHLYRSLNLPNKIASSLTAIGITHRNRMNLKEALKYFEQAMKLNKVSSNQKVLASTLINLGSTHRLLGNLNAAIEFLEKGKKIATSLEDENLMLIALQNLDDIYFNQKRYEISASYARKLNLIRDKIYNISISEALTEIRVKFETEIKEKENDLLRKQQQKDQEIIFKQNQILIIIATAATLLLIVLGFIIKIYIEKQKTNFILEQNKLEIERSHNEVQQQNQELRKLISLKDIIFSVISHDLRSPLNSINGMLSLMSLTELKQDEIASLAKDLSISVGESLNLLENLLNWAKSQLQGYKSEMIACDLSEIAKENIRLFSYATEKKGNRIINHLPEKLTVISDVNMIRLVMRNLISNANKFTTNGLITLSYKIEENKLHFTVSDTGIGISQAIQTKLKDRQSVTSIGTKSETGSGLGLFLCYECARFAGAELSFESKENEGSRFTLTVPFEN